MNMNTTRPTEPQDPTESPSPENHTGQTDSKEVILLASGLLALVLGLGGLMMYSEDEPHPATASQGNETVRITSRTDLPTAFAAVDPQKAESGAMTVSQAPAEDPAIMRDIPVAEPAETGGWMTGTDVYFALNEWTLSDEAKQTINTQLENRPEDWSGTLQVVGQTDTQGPDTYNRALGLKRAEAVKSYIVALGISESDVRVETFGEDGQICEEATPACFEQNRRAHLAFLPASPQKGNDLQLSMTSDSSNLSADEERGSSIDAPQTASSEIKASLQEEIQEETIMTEPLIAVGSLP